MNRSIRVMVVDDSAFYRQLLTHEIREAKDMEVIGTCLGRDPGFLLHKVKGPRL